MSVLYPLFVQLDDRTMLAIEAQERILYHLEAIDIENDEYRFWDSTERPVHISIAKNKVRSVSYAETGPSLQDAFLSYVDAVNLPRALVVGTPVEILRRIENELRNRPKLKSWLFRLLHRD